MKKLVSFLLCLALILSTAVVYASTDVNVQKDNIGIYPSNDLGINIKPIGANRIKLSDIYVNVPYDISQVNISRIESEGFTRVEVFDKNTGKLIEAYGEKVEPANVAKSNNKISTQSITPYTTTINTIYKERTDGPAVSRLYTILSVSTSGSFRQINSVLQTYWTEESGGKWTLENKHASTISTSGSFPTTEIETSGTATITVTTTESTTGSFSIDFLKGAGFSISSTHGSTFYLRKSISLGYRYSLY